MTTDIIDELTWRGLLAISTDIDDLRKALDAGPVTFYAGFDPTAPSLHIGNLLSIMMLRWLQKTGHCPIVLMGGGTSKIGDPSGKDTSRSLLTDAQIDANIAKIRTVFARFLDFGAGLGTFARLLRAQNRTVICVERHALLLERLQRDGFRSHRRFAGDHLSDLAVPRPGVASARKEGRHPGDRTDRLRPRRPDLQHQCRYRGGRDSCCAQGGKIDPAERR